MACDVWIGIYLNTATAKNDTVEWYFTKVIKIFRVTYCIFMCDESVSNFKLFRNGHLVPK